MPPQAPATLPADFFSKLPPDTLPANFDFNGSAPASSKPEGAVSRFLTRATGLPVSDIAEHPGKYINPFSDEYRQAARDNRNQPVGPSSVREMIPFGQTAKDLSDKNYAGALGDIAPGALAALSMARMGRSPVSERVPLWKQAGIEAGRPAPNIQVTEVPEPQLRQQSQAQAAQAEPAPVQPAKTEYPGGMQKRPTDRAEIVSDKAIQDAMRNNLEQHGWQALSQERKEFFANNGPQLGKADLIAQARAEAIRAEAEQRAQQVLAEAANPTVKLTKMPKAKVPAAAKAQPVAEDLNSPNRLVDLMQQSIDLINSRKGK